MNSRHSSHAPARASIPAAEDTASVAPVARSTRFKPKRDAITRVRHDLRSLVHAMLGSSDLLEEPHYGSLTADQARFVGHLRSSAEHVQELVETCIELSRSASDLRAIELPVVALEQVLSRVASALEG